MERDKTNTQVEQAAQNYLNSLNIDFIKKDKRDECYFVVAEKYGLSYVEVGKNPFIKYLNPGDEDYPAQAEGMTCSCYAGQHSYRFVMDNTLKIVVNLDEISKYWHVNHGNKYIFADKQNIFIPILDRENPGHFKEHYKMQHFRIVNGRGSLINTFDNLPTIEPRLNSNKLVVIDGQLYDYQKANFIGCKFNSIHSEKCSDLEQLADDWHLRPPIKEKFVDEIAKKMVNKNLLIGISTILATRLGFDVKYKLLVFLDNQGNPVGDLYYVDDEYDLLSVPVSKESVPPVLQDLQNKANSRLTEIFAKIEKGREVFKQINESHLI